MNLPIPHRQLLSVWLHQASFFILLSTLSSALWAASGTEAASFLEIPVGAEAAAMGNAYSALAANAYAPTYNPAGLGFTPATQIAGQHLSYLESIHYEYLSFVHPVKPGSAWGAAMQYLGSGDIAQTNELGQQTGSFSSHFAAYSLAYGQQINDKISLGIAAKWINAQISDVSANAYAGDAGIMIRPSDKLTLAGVVSNAGTQLKFLNDGGSLPLISRLGAAYSLTSKCSISADGIYHAYGLMSGHVGMEIRPTSFVKLRAGYKTDTTSNLGPMAGVTAGIGLDVFGQEFSYAWVPLGDLGMTQYFSLLIRIGQTKSGQRNLIEYKSRNSFETVNDQSPNEVEYQQLMQLLAADPDILLTQGADQTGATR